MSISLVAENHRLEKLLTDKDNAITTMELRINRLEEDLRLSKALRTDNERLKSVVQRFGRSNAELTEDLRSKTDDEEKINLEMAFLAEDKEYVEKHCKILQAELSDTKRKLDAIYLELARYKTINVLLKVKSSEKLEYRVDEINELLREKRQFVQYIRDGLPITDITRRMPLARTEDLLAVRIQLNETTQQLEYVTSTAMSQELRIQQLTAMVTSLKESSQRPGRCGMQPLSPSAASSSSRPDTRHTTAGERHK